MFLGIIPFNTRRIAAKTPVGEAKLQQKARSAVKPLQQIPRYPSDARMILYLAYICCGKPCFFGWYSLQYRENCNKIPGRGGGTATKSPVNSQAIATNSTVFLRFPDGPLSCLNLLHETVFLGVLFPSTLGELQQKARSGGGTATKYPVHFSDPQTALIRINISV